MSSTFLNQFAEAWVSRLLVADLLELRKGREIATARHLADYLHQNGKGRSLLSTVEQALLKCDDVIEFYADQDTLKDIVETLKYGV